jgi:hypothetical protein
MATHNIMKKGLIRIYMATIIQKRNYLSLIQYRSARNHAITYPADLLAMPAVAQLQLEV